MLFWIKYIRYIILSTSMLLAGAIFYFTIIGSENISLAYIKLVQIYALCAVVYLYFALLASPLYKTFPLLPLKAVYIKARKAIGVSAFLFALLHAEFAFFKILGGLQGIQVLEGRVVIAISLGNASLFILGIMAVTSLDALIKKLGRYWKPLHRLVYFAGILTIAHALMLGSHFTDISRAIPKIFFTALLILLSLETARIYSFLKKHIQKPAP